MNKICTLTNGKTVSALGQGTWFMGEKHSQQQQEISALKFGIEQGLNLIDTAEMYANGGAEKIVAEAISGQRDKVFIVSKVLPMNASQKGTITACENSLRRLKTDYLDLYLLHWRGHIPLSETISAMENLVNNGKIRAWGVSNFDLDDMLELNQYCNLDQIQTNQVLYNLTRRGIEFDLLPWSQQNHIPIMAYSPIEQGRLLSHPVLQQIAKQHQATSAQIALAWVLSHQQVIAIPKSANIEHIKQNIASLTIKLSTEEQTLLNQAFPPPKRKISLQML